MSSPIYVVYTTCNFIQQVFFHPHIEEVHIVDISVYQASDEIRAIANESRIKAWGKNLLLE